MWQMQRQLPHYVGYGARAASSDCQILAGMRQASLTNSTWWYCVSCGTCAGRCPVEINMYQVATSLCEMAEAAGIRPAEPAIHLFEALFLKSVQQHGRVQELQTVGEYNLRRLTPFKDALKGMQLMARGAIDPRTVLAAGRRRDAAVAAIFERVQRDSHSTIGP